MAAEAQLDLSVALLQSTMDLLPDGILLVDDSRRILYFNETFRIMWRIPDRVIASNDSKQFIDCVLDKLKDPSRFLSKVEYLYGVDSPSEDEVAFKDGRTIKRRSVAYKNAQIASSARVWIFTDITELKEAERDPLTQLHNRLKFEKEFSTLMQKDLDGGLRCLAMIDVDNFKMYNDLYGHAAGDNALTQVGQSILQKITQESDHAYRIGGEEFAIICHGNFEKSMIDFIDGIKNAVSSLGIIHNGNPPYGCVTISIGLGIFNAPQDSSYAYNAVDNLLYQAKKNGRNRLEVATLG